MARSRKVWVTGLVAIAAAIAGCGGGGGSAAGGGGGGGPVKIGAPLPLTGDFAAYAKTWKNGLQLAVDEVNASGGINGRKIDLKIEDWAGDTAKAVSTFTKLANVDKVPVEIGGVSGGVLAQAPVAERTQTVLINAAAQTPDLRKAGDYVFSDINEASTEADDLVKYLKQKMGISQAVIYYVDDATGEGGRDALQAAAKAQGVQIMDVVAHSLEDTNYRTVLSRIKAKNPPAVLVASHWENTGLSLKQAQGLGLKTKWLGLSPTVSDVTIKTAGVGPIEGFVTVRSEYDVKSTQKGTPAAQFVAKYKKRFHSQPDIYAAHFYDAVLLVKKAIEEGATDGPSLQKALAGFNSSNPFTGGVTGKTAFDQDGMVRKPNYILVAKNGKLQLVK